MSAIFLPEDVRSLVKGKTVVYIGDSVQRSMYKDLVLLFQEKRYLTDKELRKKGEECFMGDELLEGGCKGEMLNSINYREVRKFLFDSDTRILYFFVTACFGQYIEMILTKLKTPDIIIMNSCLWDVHRYGLKEIQGYESNLLKLVKFVKKTHPGVLFLWTTTPPVDLKSKGGFLKRPGTDEVKIFEVSRCNRIAKEVMREQSMNLVELDTVFHYFTRHRANDGVHWNEKAHRRMTNMILETLARCLNKPVPRVMNKEAPFIDDRPEMFHPEQRMSHSFSYPEFDAGRWHGRTNDFDVMHDRSFGSNYSYFENEEEMMPNYRTPPAGRFPMEQSPIMRPPSGPGYRFGTNDPIMFRENRKRKSRDEDSPWDNVPKRQRYEPGRRLSDRENKGASPIIDNNPSHRQNQQEGPLHSKTKVGSKPEKNAEEPKLSGKNFDDKLLNDYERDKEQFKESELDAKPVVEEKPELEKKPALDEKPAVNEEFAVVDSTSRKEAAVQNVVADEEKKAIYESTSNSQTHEMDVAEDQSIDLSNDNTWSLMDSSYCEVSAESAAPAEEKLVADLSNSSSVVKSDVEMSEGVPKTVKDSEEAIPSHSDDPTQHADDSKVDTTSEQSLTTLKILEAIEKSGTPNLNVEAKPKISHDSGTDDKSSEKSNETEDKSILSTLSSSAAKILEFLGKSSKSATKVTDALESDIVMTNTGNVDAETTKHSGNLVEETEPAKDNQGKEERAPLPDEVPPKSVQTQKKSSAASSIAFYDVEYTLEDIEASLDLLDDDAELYDGDDNDDEALLMDDPEKVTDSMEVTIKDEASPQSKSGQKSMHMAEEGKLPATDDIVIKSVETSTDLQTIEDPVSSSTVRNTLSKSAIQLSSATSILTNVSSSPVKSVAVSSIFSPVKQISSPPSAASSPTAASMKTLSSPGKAFPALSTTSHASKSFPSTARPANALMTASNLKQTLSSSATISSIASSVKKAVSSPGKVSNVLATTAVVPKTLSSTAVSIAVSSRASNVNLTSSPHADATGMSSTALTMINSLSVHKNVANKITSTSTKQGSQNPTIGDNSSNSVLNNDGKDNLVARTTTQAEQPRPKLPCVPNPPSLDMKSPFYKPKPVSVKAKGNISTNVSSSGSFVPKPVKSLGNSLAPKVTSSLTSSSVKSSSVKSSSVMSSSVMSSSVKSSSVTSSSVKSSSVTSPSVSRSLVTTPSATSVSGSPLKKKSKVGSKLGKTGASKEKGLSKPSDVKKSPLKKKAKISKDGSPVVKKRKLSKGEGKSKNTSTPDGGDKKKTKKVKKKKTIPGKEKTGKEKTTSAKKSSKKNASDSSKAVKAASVREPVVSTVPVSFTDTPAYPLGPQNITPVIIGENTRPKPRPTSFQHAHYGQEDWNANGLQHAQTNAIAQPYSFTGYPDQQYQQTFVNPPSYQIPPPPTPSFIATGMQQPQVAVVAQNTAQQYQYAEPYYVPQVNQYTPPTSYFPPNIQYQENFNFSGNSAPVAYVDRSVESSSVFPNSVLNAESKPKKEYVHLDWL